MHPIDCIHRKQREAHQASLVVSIIIPVHNQSRYTNSCLASLCSFKPDLPWEAIVVDDGSSDDTVDVVTSWSAREPHIRLVTNPSPHRFAAACNRGAAEARGSYLLFLNNDIELLEGWFRPLITVLLERPEIGIAAPKLLFPDGTVQHCGKVLRQDRQGMPVFEHILYGQPDGSPGSAGGDFPAVTGACMLVRREQFQRYGAFDERYENGWEDDDLCLAYRQQGLGAAVCGASVMIHDQGGTLKAEAAAMERFLAVMRGKGYTLAPDDPLLLSLKERAEAGVQRFEKALQSNRALFYSKWLPQLEQLVCGGAEVPTAAGETCATIIVVSYNSAKTLSACLEGVFVTLRPGDRVIVVDNASQDATVAMLRDYMRRDRRLKCIANRENRGYSAAANQGLDRADTPFVVFLNPDTVVTPGWLERLLAHCRDERVAAVGPLSNFAAADQSVDRHWQGPLPQGISPDQATALLYGWNAGSHLETPLLIGFCLLVRRAPLVELGGLDERLFLGNDDLELSWRLRLHGHLQLIARDVFVYHEGQHSFRSEPTETVNSHLQQSSAALYRILQDHYGPGRVPPPQDLWGIDWFSTSQGVFNPDVAWHQVLTPPRGARRFWAENGPLVSIIILTCNQLSYTQECIAALLRHTPEPVEIIMVDNGSRDGTVPWLQALAQGDPRFSLILNGENRGFAAGCNQGIARAHGKFIVLLNNDAVVTPEWLSGLLECHAAVSGAGIVGPLTNSASGIQVIDPPPYAMGEELDRFALELRSRNRFRRVPWRRIVGFCALFTRELAREIGPLDESFGAGNYEDDDYCLRAAIAGYRNLVAGDVFVHHYGGVSFSGLGLDYRVALAGNSGLFREKWSRPVTDPELGQRIAVCRAREDLERLLLEERYEEGEALVQDFDRHFPGTTVLRDRAADMTRQQVSPAEQGDPAAALPLLARAEEARRRGEEGEYAQALTVKAFILEPWRPVLIRALQDLPLQAGTALTPLVEAAARLYPDSRGLARLRVERLAVEGQEGGLAAAQHYLQAFGPDERILALGLKLRAARGAYRRSAPAGKSVALCMIVRNEERHLARCLASCLPLVHEVTVVDTGSGDRTLQIAELFGASVKSFPWNGDFSAARNASLAGATADWLLVMDADEVISPRDHDLFRQVLADTQTPAAFSLTTRNYTTLATLDEYVACAGQYPEDEAGTGWTPSAKIRLFPNDSGIHFSGVVHELVEESIAGRFPVLPHPVPVHHYGGLEQARLRRKREIYYALGQRKLQEGGQLDLKALYELAIQAAELERYEEAEEAWRRFLAECNDFPAAWCNFGYVLMHRGQLDQAWDALERALRLQPDYHAARVNRALCAYCRWPEGQAVELIRTELERAPEDIILRLLADLCRTAGDPPEKRATRFSQLVAQGYGIGAFLDSTASLMELVGRHAQAEQLRNLLTMLSR